MAKKGLKVIVLESRSILGGRARSWIDGVTRDPVHIGPHVVVSEYPNFFKLLEELGTTDKTLAKKSSRNHMKSLLSSPFQSISACVSWRLRIVWQPWRHFLTWVNGRQEHHIRTWALPAPASWGPASILDPFVSWADKHSTVPAAVHCLSLSEEQLIHLVARRRQTRVLFLSISQHLMTNLYSSY